MLPFSKVYGLAERHWENWFDRVQPVVEKYRLRYAYATIFSPKASWTFMPKFIQYSSFFGIV
jgi:hypothetical protein